MFLSKYDMFVEFCRKIELEVSGTEQGRKMYQILEDCLDNELVGHATTHPSGRS